MPICIHIMEICDVLLIIVLIMLIYRLCARQSDFDSNAPTADQLLYQLNLSGLCQANVERNQKLYDEIRNYKKAEEERKKKQDELISEQQTLNNMLKIRAQEYEHGIRFRGVDPLPYNGGDFSFVAGDCIDSRVTKKIISSNLQSKDSIDGRLKWNSREFSKFVRPELDEYGDMIWWHNDSLEM